MNKKFEFFWGGIYSNWHRSGFVIDDISYNCGEQYMMHQKALLMDDEETARKIMLYSNPKRQKELGREIKNFNSKLWDKYKYEIMLKGLTEKFNQNEPLKRDLMASEADLFVEASPFDKIWGIGLDERTAHETPQSEWPGENLLGKIITEIRNNFKNDSN